MPIKFRCPHCRQFLGISRQKAGSLSDCPTCGRTLRVPNLDGTVDALPSPKLNLEDSDLRHALGALASLEDESDSNSYEEFAITPPPDAPSKKGQDISSEMPIVIAKPMERHSEVMTTQENVTKDTAGHLQEIASMSTVSPIIEEEGEMIESRLALQMVLGCSIATLVFGFFIGRYTAPVVVQGQESSVQQNQPVLENHKQDVEKNVPRAEDTPVVTGNLSYVAASGESRPDRGARILILPLDQQAEQKLVGTGFRVGAEAEERETLQERVYKLGGAFDLADESGDFEIGNLSPGRYAFLVASRYQGRDSSQPFAAEVSNFLEQYFEQPTQVIGQVEHHFKVIVISEDVIAEVRHQFAKN